LNLVRRLLKGERLTKNLTVKIILSKIIMFIIGMFLVCL